MTAIVEIENLTKDYEVGFWRKRKVRALDGLSLQVNQGEIFGFLGANGAGKTTTLKLLMRLMFPTAGNARILGHDIADLRMHRQIGYLPENPYFYDYLTAREFLDYCAQLFGNAKHDRRTTDYGTAGASTPRQEVMGRSTAQVFKGHAATRRSGTSARERSAIVFLDEPMSGLDPVDEEVRDLIAGLRQGQNCLHELSYSF